MSILARLTCINLYHFRPNYRTYTDNHSDYSEDYGEVDKL